MGLACYMHWSHVQVCGESVNQTGDKQSSEK